jgi:energy-coupling factor transport system ATP-binding protein
MLRFEDVGFGYGEGPVINGLSFSLGRGEFAVLLGENGAGKSTVCRLCNGLLKPHRGRVLLAGQDTRQVKTSALARHVGYLFQNPDRQLCKNTVGEEILFGLDFVLEGPPQDREKEKKRRLEEMLELFHLDGGRDPFGLSRGERQQVALAGVLARKPEFLVLDEPTTGLDYRECTLIMGIISDLNSRGATVLMITHDMEVAADYARRALILSRGRLAGDGPVREIMGDQALLGAASLLPAQIPALARLLAPPLSGAFTVQEMLELCVKTAGPAGGGEEEKGEKGGSR